MSFFADYPDYSAQYPDYPAQVKYEDEYEEKYRPPQQSDNGQYGREEGEYNDYN